MEADDIIIRGSNGKTFYWTLGAKYKGDKFIEHTVTALNALSDDPKTANFSFKGRKSTGIDFKGNAVLDYAAGGSKDEKNVFIEHADNNPMDPGENQHIKGTVYWDPSRGVVEEGLNGEKGGGAFPSVGTLIHEMGHAALFNEFGGDDWQNRQDIFANEESMITDRLEKPALQSMGFGYRTSESATYKNRSAFLKGVNGSLKNGLPVKGAYFVPSVSPLKLK